MSFNSNNLTNRKLFMQIIEGGAVSAYEKFY